MPFIHKKCQKIRQFSVEKAFLAKFLMRMLVGLFNFAKAKKQRLSSKKMPLAKCILAFFREGKKAT